MTGSGTLADPYIIYDADDLQAVQNDLAAYYELADDIDASATSTWNGGLGFLPIGLWVNWGAAVPAVPYIACAGVNWKQTPFTGHFDGKGHSISDLTIHRTQVAAPTTTCPDWDSVGLFSHLGDGAVVQNLTLENVDIDGYQCVGALAGQVYTQAGIITLSNCSSSGTVDGEHDDTGGLIGLTSGYAAETITISSCFSSANVTADDNVGGLVGLNYQADLDGCYATGTVDAVGVGVATGFYAGGLIGSCYGVSEITESYATGAVTGNNHGVGGLIGVADGSVIDDCYAAGNVSGDHNVGGLVGCTRVTAVTIGQSFATGGVTATYQAGGLVGYADVETAIDRSFATGDITCGNLGGWSAAGGLIGEHDSGPVTDSYARGNVTATGEYVGGLVGYNIGDIDRCYSTGAVAGSAIVGGLVGDSDGTVDDSFWDTDTSGTLVSDGGTGQTTAQMKTPATFVTAAWDFGTDWWMTGASNDGYPCLLDVTPSCAMGAVACTSNPLILFL